MIQRPELPGISVSQKEGTGIVPLDGCLHCGPLDRITLTKTEHVTLFYGCELDLKNTSAWMTTAEVSDHQGISGFQIIYLNCKPQDLNKTNDIKAKLIEFDEIYLKLVSTKNKIYKQLTSIISSKQKHILIRHCKTGMICYPNSIIPISSNQIASNHLRKLINEIGYDTAEQAIKLQDDMYMEHISTKRLPVLQAKRYVIDGLYVYVYGLVLKNDPWKYYEIISPFPIENTPEEDLFIRIDSGCDIGQIYNDDGCDCREQLHSAVKNMRNHGSGIIIHIPSHDGRGFGAAIKLETEGLKRGLKVATNAKQAQPMDTISAAKALLGDDFDIRTYDGVGDILKMLKVKSVLLITDNRLKVQSLESCGIQVKRNPTNTKGANGSSCHIAAKHNYEIIYYK